MGSQFLKSFKAFVNGAMMWRGNGVGEDLRRAIFHRGCAYVLFPQGHGCIC
ncbi:hypothetical protein [Microbacter margulisiae]|uniref:Uncharacterized protein n=1 Tax=Microbacter margulisiae TaxID=1350067 RepID=A0A7W5DQX5_9PORP|nr:hypothetical protein [Microbacter margulisiae]MBB3186645.1 hypothetical protein [Microbacter margulisiae]MBB3187447.1 hypothetical protein [Microbacter margulisiae]